MLIKRKKMLRSENLSTDKIFNCCNCRQSTIRNIRGIKYLHKLDISEFKHDVYGRRQTAKMTSEFVFFSSNAELNQIKIEKYLLLVTTNTNIFTLQFKELRKDGKSSFFPVCRLT